LVCLKLWLVVIESEILSTKTSTARFGAFRNGLYLAETKAGAAAFEPSASGPDHATFKRVRIEFTDYKPCSRPLFRGGELFCIGLGGNCDLIKVGIELDLR
jgi:hypothetical protein